MPQDPTGELDRRSEFPAFATDRSEPQQRDVTHRLMITRLRSGAISIAIISRRSASLMAARTFALPTLARSAIRATGRVHFPVAAASFRMTASTAIASVFRSSLIEGGTTTVAARNRRPHATRWAVSDLLRFSTIRVSITTSFRRSGPSKESTRPISFNGGGEAKVGAADFGQRPLSSTCDAQPMNSQPGKLSVLPGRVKTGGVTPVVYDGHFCGCIHL
jgi:hypothetical protein